MFGGRKKKSSTADLAKESAIKTQILGKYLNKEFISLRLARCSSIGWLVGSFIG